VRPPTTAGNVAYTGYESSGFAYCLHDDLRSAGAISLQPGIRPQLRKWGAKVVKRRAGANFDCSNHRAERKSVRAGWWRSFSIVPPRQVKAVKQSTEAGNCTMSAERRPHRGSGSAPTV